jgi:serine/threonine protein kinase
MIQKVGKYAVVEKLGEGSMGAVYRAYDSVLDRYVAIKTMADDIKWDPELKLRFYREARSAANIHHPNIVTIHDLGEEGKITYIVMELLEGTDLKAVIANRTPFSLEEKLAIMIQVSDGLNHAHLHGIVHRDIKPGNIHLSAAGNAKILDFGIARIPSSDLTRMGARLGTPVYMSPEQIRGEEYDARSDIFATGIVFYELITYCHPFRDKKVAKTLDNILTQEPPAVTDFLPDAPANLGPIIGKCLAKVPKDRYSSMAELSRACRDLLEEMTLARQKMSKDLEAALPVLRQKTEVPDASPRLRELLKELQRILTQKEKSDYLSLARITASLAQGSLPGAVPGATPQSPAFPTGTPARPADPVGSGNWQSPRIDSYGARPSGELRSTSTPQPAEPVRAPQSGTQAPVISGTPPPKEVPAAPEPQVDVPYHDLVRNVEQLLQEGQLTEAQTVLRKAIGSLGPKDDLVGMLAETRRKIEEKKRVQIGPLLEAARTAMAQGQFLQAVETLDGVFELIPEQTEAVDLRRQILVAIDAEKDRQARKEKGERDRSIGFKLLAEKKFRDSLQALRNAQSLLGDDTAVRLGIEEAEEEVRAEELRERARSGLAEAAEAFRTQAYDKARGHANRVLELFPKNAEAVALLAAIEQAEAKKRAREALAGLLKQGEDALAHRDFDVALTLAREAQQLDAANPQVSRLIERIDQSKEQTRRQEEVARLLSKVEEALKRKDLDEAEYQANQALKVIADHPKAVEFLNQIRRAREEKRQIQEIIHAISEAEQALEAGNLERCEAQVRHVLGMDPGNGKAKNLLARAGMAREKAKADQIRSLLEQARGALALGDFQRAGTSARDVTLLDAANQDARQLLADIEKAQEKRKRDEIDSFFARAREEVGQKKFVEAGELIKLVLSREPKHKEAKALQKEIAKGIRVQENEQRKEQKAAESAKQHAVAPEPPDAPPDQESTVLLAKKGGKKAYVLIAAAAVVLIGISIAGWFYLKNHRTISQDASSANVEAQLASAKSELDQRQFSQAIETLQGILAVSPDQEQARALLEEAQKQKRQADIDVLMVEIQNERSQKQNEEALKTIQRVLDIDSAYAPALAIRADIEGEAAAGKSKEEQDRLTKEGIAKVDALLNAGKMAEAKSEIDKIERIRPDAPQLPALRQRWNAKTNELAAKNADEQKHKQILDLSSRAEEGFRQGKYAEVRDLLTQILALAPQNEAALALRGKTSEALASLKQYEDLFAAKEYDEALGAVARLEKANPADPNLAELRRRADASKASAKALFSVYRLTEPGSLFLDGQSLGNVNEVESRTVVAGRHKLEVRFSNGKQSFVEMPFPDGQSLTFVYDAPGAILRLATQADRDALATRNQREEVHRFTVDHQHGGFFGGKCTGELAISGLRVEYKPTEGNHRMSALFQNLTLNVKDDKLDIMEKPGDKQYTFKVKDAKQAEAIRQIWDSLKKLVK